MSMKEEYTAHDMATAAADGFRAGQRAAQSAGVPDVSAMARVLSDRSADACNIDRTDNWAMYGHEFIDDVRAMLAAAPAPVVPEVPALWAKSLGFCWAADADYPEEDWIVGTVDEDGNRYDVLRVEASQYDAAGESQKIAEAIVALWAWAAHPAERQEQGEVHSAAARDVLAERRRQIEAEGWTPEHDDAYAEGDLAQAAGCYSLYAHCSENLDGSPADWPWPEEWWKPAGSRRNLVKAGALILAEIERLDRAARAASTAKQGEGEQP